MEEKRREKKGGGGGTDSLITDLRKLTFYQNG